MELQSHFSSSSASIKRPNLLSKYLTNSECNLWKLAYLWKNKPILDSEPFWAKMAYSLEYGLLSKEIHFPKSKPFRPQMAYFPKSAYL